MALQCHDDFCDGHQINSNLINEINEIFDDLWCLSYTQSFQKLISLYDKYLINSTCVESFITITLSHITKSHIYNPSFGSFYKQLSNKYKDANNSISFQDLLLQIFQTQFKNQWHKGTFMKFIGQLYKEKLLPFSFITMSLDKLFEDKVYPLNISDARIISICELLQSVNILCNEPKYYHRLIFISFARNPKETFIHSSFAHSFIKETLSPFESHLQQTFDVKSVYWSLITFGFVRELVHDLALNISIEGIGKIITFYVYDKDQKEKMRKNLKIKSSRGQRF